MIELPALPYDYDAFEPTISEETMRLHHDKHHATYVEKTNALAAKAGLGVEPLEDIIKAAKAKDDKPLFDNAAQAWNHAFFWASMTPDQAKPQGDLAAAIDAAFGDLAGLKTKFVDEGKGHFGSGWVWLAKVGGDLKVLSTHDAEDLVTEAGKTPLLVCDLWEHAYYLDHQNDRAGFLGKWFDQLANWAFAAEQFAATAKSDTLFKYGAPQPDYA